MWLRCVGGIPNDHSNILAMGEAKRRALRRAASEAFSRPLKPARFDLYALGARRAASRLVSEERAYWCDTEERVLGMIFRDTVDDDYGWILMARDKIGRFRCVDLEVSLTREAVAVDKLRERIALAVQQQDFVALGDQGDETNYPTDVLALPADVPRDRLHPYFRLLIEHPERHPSIHVFKEIGPWLAPADPHFVREFQLSQFDQRLWEMYLWATFRELGFDVSQPEAPDFLCEGPGVSFTVEATTVSPSTSGVLADHPDPNTPEELAEFLQHYMPIKFGSSLTSKLNKRDKDGRNYWERGDAANKPFLLAVADFHVPATPDKLGSMTYTHSALWPYLYGRRVEWEFSEGGKLLVRAVQGQNHSYKGKIIETGFFDLPGAENISAIIFSNAGTLSKFDRMGIAAGFLPLLCKYYRRGFKYNPDPNAVDPVFFSEEVCRNDYVEHWSDELQVFHNPRARIPLADDFFGGITQHFFKGSEQISITPEGVVLGSQTMILSEQGNYQQSFEPT